MSRYSKEIQILDDITSKLINETQDKLRQNKETASKMSTDEFCRTIDDGISELQVYEDLVKVKRKYEMMQLKDRVIGTIKIGFYSIKKELFG